MVEVSQKILEKIHAEKIIPTPRWQCLLKRWVFRIVFLLAVLLGTIFFNLILQNATVSDWQVLHHLRQNHFEFLLIFVPYAWFLVLGLLWFLAYYNWKHTRHAYRYHGFVAFFLSIIVSLLGGFALFYLGLGKMLDQQLVKNFPTYQQMKRRAVEQIWARPAEGLFLGRIEEEISPSPELPAVPVKVKDFQGEVWEVVVPEEIVRQEVSKRKKGDVVKFIGEIGSEERKFKAQEAHSDDDCGCWEEDASKGDPDSDRD